MQIAQITNYTAASKSKINANKTIFKRNSNNTNPHQNTFKTDSLLLLSDTNRGSLLVNKKNIAQAFQTEHISFKGVEKIPMLVPEIIKKIPLEERIGSLMEIMTNNDVIVAAKNKKTALKLLNKASDAFANVIKRIFYLPEEKIPEAIAIVKTDIAPGFINLGENPVFISNLEGQNLLVKTKGSVWTKPDAKIHIGNNMGMDIIKQPEKTFQFSIKEQSNENLSMLRSQFSEPFNKSNDVQKSIDNVNKKTFKSLLNEYENKKTFGLADVGGMDNVVQELKKNILYPIKYPKMYENRNLNHGIILYGPPGTGKTFVAKALANDIGANYFEVDAGSLRGSLVGQTEANWRKVFQEAIDNQPSILLVDECDAVFKKRSSLQPYAADELNQILSLLSDLEKNNEQVFVIATTNKVETLDDAILRGGRLGKQIEIKNPDMDGIKDILNKQLKSQPVDKDFNKEEFAKKLFEKGLNGSDMKQINDNAYDMANERLQIFEKMEAGTIQEEDLANLTLKQEDFDKALDKYLAQNLKASGTNKRKPIGFRPQQVNTTKEAPSQTESQLIAMG